MHSKIFVCAQYLRIHIAYSCAVKNSKPDPVHMNPDNLLKWTCMFAVHPSLENHFHTNQINHIHQTDLGLHQKLQCKSPIPQIKAKISILCAE